MKAHLRDAYILLIKERKEDPKVPALHQGVLEEIVTDLDEMHKRATWDLADARREIVRLSALHQLPVEATNPPSEVDLAEV